MYVPEWVVMLVGTASLTHLIAGIAWAIRTHLAVKVLQEANTEEARAARAQSHDYHAVKSDIAVLTNQIQTLIASVSRLGDKFDQMFERVADIDGRTKGRN